MKAILPNFSYPLNDNLVPQLHEAMDRGDSFQKNYDPVAKFFSNTIKQQPCVETSFWNLVSEKEKCSKAACETSLNEIFKESRKSFNKDVSAIFSHKDYDASKNLSSPCLDTLRQSTCFSNVWGDPNENHFGDFESTKKITHSLNNSFNEKKPDSNICLTKKKIELKKISEKFNITLERKNETDKIFDSLNDDPTLWNCLAKRIQYRKTKRCPWFSKGKCWLNDQCNYAHDDNELHDRPDLSCTRICVQGSNCSDVHCRFAHSYTELRSTDVFFRTKLCKYWASGVKCPCGIHCRHAHGTQQLRRIQLDTFHDTVQPSQSLISTDQSSKNSKCVMSPSFSFSSLTSSQSNQICVPFLNYPVHDFHEKKKTMSVSIPLKPKSESDNVCKPPSHLIEASSTSPIGLVLEKTNTSMSFLKEKSVDILSPTQTERDISPSTTLSQYDSITSFPTKTRIGLQSPTILEDNNHSIEASSQSIIHLNEILDLAVASSDPELLESSARVLRASLKLKTYNQVELNKTRTENNPLLTTVQKN